MSYKRWGPKSDDDTYGTVERSGTFEDPFKNHRVTRAKTHPPYVYSKRGALVHKISYVDLHWTEIRLYPSRTVRLKSPRWIPHTVCGMSFFVEPGRAATCAVPAPEATLCGKCHGEAATFSRRPGAKRHVNFKDAAAKLGCMVTGE